MARGDPAWFRDEKLTKQISLSAQLLVENATIEKGDRDLDLFLRGIVTSARQGPFGATVEGLAEKLNG